MKNYYTLADYATMVGFVLLIIAIGFLHAFLTRRREQQRLKKNEGFYIVLKHILTERIGTQRAIDFMRDCSQPFSPEDAGANTCGQSKLDEIAKAQPTAERFLVESDGAPAAHPLQVALRRKWGNAPTSPEVQVATSRAAEAEFLEDLKAKADARFLESVSAVAVTGSSNMLDDFIANAAAYNANCLAQFISRAVERNAHLTGGPIDVTINGIYANLSIKDVLRWCCENPQPIGRLELAIDLMVSGWERAKFMELVDEIKTKQDT